MSLSQIQSFWSVLRAPGKERPHYIPLYGGVPREGRGGSGFQRMKTTDLVHEHIVRLEGNREAVENADHPGAPRHPSIEGNLIRTFHRKVFNRENPRPSGGEGGPKDRVRGPDN